MTKANIYYGIYNGVKDKMVKWETITGPASIFVVKDDKIHHFEGKKYLDKYDVVTIDEALERYPDAEIWLTYANPTYAKTVAKELMAKVLINKIHFLEVDLEYRKSCFRLGRSIHYARNRIPMCTVGNRKKPFIDAQKTVNETITAWQNYSNKLVYANQLDSPNRCFGCPLLKADFYPKSLEVRNLRFLQNLKYDACNFRCIYCEAANTERFSSLKKIDAPTTKDVIREFYEMPEFRNLGKDFTITFANGELCANRFFDEIIDILLKTEWRIEILSNLSIYREKLTELMNTGRVVKIITSIDAGTRETFKKIKRNDRFDIVLENLKKYPINKTTLYLKYLFLEGVNDNEIDIDGYYQIAKDAGAVIMLSTDNTTNSKPFTENNNMRTLVLRLINKAKDDGIRVIADDNNISLQDVEFINKHFRA